MGVILRLNSSVYFCLFLSFLGPPQGLIWFIWNSTIILHGRTLYSTKTKENCITDGFLWRRQKSTVSDHGLYQNFLSNFRLFSKITMESLKKIYVFLIILKFPLTTRSIFSHFSHWGEPVAFWSQKLYYLKM